MNLHSRLAPAIAVGALLAGCQPSLPTDTKPTGDTPSTTQEVQSVAAMATVTTTRSPHGITCAFGKVFVCNVGSNVLSVLNGATGAKEADLTVQQGPGYAATSDDGKRVIALNGASGSISIFGSDLVPTHLLNIGSKPDKVHETHDGHYAYVTLVGEANVAKVDLQVTPPTFSKIAVGPAEGHRSLIVLDDMVIAPDSAGNTVRLIATSNDAVTPVTVGTKPNAIAVGYFWADGATKRILVAGNNGANTASLIDLASKTVVKTLDVGIAPSDAVAVGKNVYLTNSGSNTVSVIDVQEQKVVATIAVGTKPVHTFVSPPGGGGPASQVWIGNDGESFVSVIDTATNKVFAKVEVQAGHHKMAFTPDGKKAFITNLSSNSVSVIDRTTIK